MLYELVREKYVYASKQNNGQQCCRKNKRPANTSYLTKQKLKLLVLRLHYRRLQYNTIYEYISS